MFSKKECRVSNIIKEKLKANNEKALMPTLRGAPIAFCFRLRVWELKRINCLAIF